MLNVYICLLILDWRDMVIFGARGSSTVVTVQGSAYRMTNGTSAQWKASNSAKQVTWFVGRSHMHEGDRISAS